MVHDVLFAFWFMLPAAIANMVPILVAPLPGLRNWQAPIDGGRQWRAKPLLGSHKTWRGLVCGVIAAGLTFWVQKTINQHVGWYHMQFMGTEYLQLPWIFGPLLGFGALAGDSIASCIKRQIGIASGQKWVPIDQLDYIIGAVVISLPFIILPLGVYVWISIIWFGMHLLFSYLGWLLKLKEQPL